MPEVISRGAGADGCKQQNQSNSKPNNEVHIKRSLGVWNGIAIIISVIVGSGIFISPKGVLMHSGSVGASLLVWCACGLLALLGALCFAELGTSIASSGGEYTYISLAYGPLASFLYIWVIVLIIMPCSNAVAALTFANYCLQPLFSPDCAPPEQAIRLLALAILMILIYVNCASLSGSIRMQSSFTLAKVFAVGLIIIYGCIHLIMGNPFASLSTTFDHDHFQNLTEALPAMAETDPNTSNKQDEAPGAGDSEVSFWDGTQTSLPHLARAFYSGFYTYSGWNSLNCVTEEMKDPVKNMPRAIIVSIATVTGVYILANTAYFAVLTKSEILASDAIAVLFGEKVLPSYLASWLMPLVVALSTMGGLSASIFAASRIYFVAARQGQLFEVLQMISLSECTPIPALLLLGATSAVYLSTTQITTLIEYTTFVEASFAALGVSTMLVIRYQQPNLARPLRVPLIVPIVYLLFSAAMLLLPLWSSPIQAIIGVAITLTGLPVYYLTARWKVKPPFYQRMIDKFNGTTQKLTMCVVPARDCTI